MTKFEKIRKKFFFKENEEKFPRIGEVMKIGVLDLFKWGIVDGMKKIKELKGNNTHLILEIIKNSETPFNTKEFVARSVLNFSRRKKMDSFKTSRILGNKNYFAKDIEGRNVLSTQRDQNNKIHVPRTTRILKEMLVSFFLESKKPIGKYAWSSVFNNFFMKKGGNKGNEQGDKIYIEYYQTYGESMDSWWDGEFGESSGMWKNDIRKEIWKVHEKR